MKKTIIEDRDIESDKIIKKNMSQMESGIDDLNESKKDILTEKFIQSGGATPNIKEALLRLEKNSLLTPFIPIETHRNSFAGKGIVWLKRLILKAMLRLDVSLKHQNYYNANLAKTTRQLVDKIESMENRINSQQRIIDDLTKKIK